MGQHHDTNNINYEGYAFAVGVVELFLELAAAGVYFAGNAGFAQLRCIIYSSRLGDVLV